MRLSLGICLVLFVGCIVAEFEDDRALYEEFKQMYRKNYANNDDHKRFAIFRDNLKRAQQYQEEEQGTAIYGVTEFSDLTAEEFRDQFANARFDDTVEYTDRSLLGELDTAPTSFDWRQHGAVGPVLNQGSCGSCWSFSVIGNIEGQWFKKTGRLLSLSQQQLVDCDRVDHGCSGGWPPKTYGEVKRLGGIELASDYPYRGVQQACKINPKKFKAYVNSSVTLPPNEMTQAGWLALNGPIASALNANPLQFYRGGILHPTVRQCSPSGLNHAVLTVGYGVERGIPYWIVKNSWAARFGERGYFRIFRGEGTCGINRVCSSAIIR